jgi:hypothetical protein
MLIIDSCLLDLSEHSPGGAKLGELIAAPLDIVFEHNYRPAMPHVRDWCDIGREAGDWTGGRRESRSTGRVGHCQCPARADGADD